MWRSKGRFSVSSMLFISVCTNAHMNYEISHLTLQLLHYNSCITILTSQFIHRNSYIKIPTSQFFEHNSCITTLVSQFLHRHKHHKLHHNLKFTKDAGRRPIVATYTKCTKVKQAQEPHCYCDKTIPAVTYFLTVTLIVP